jgi:hypothetical protein
LGNRRREHGSYALHRKYSKWMDERCGRMSTTKNEGSTVED